MRDYINNCVDTMVREYTQNPKRIRSDYNHERESIDAYKGRELLELIQNADDELQEDMSKEVRIRFADNVLTISNNGTPFSRDGIDSLMYSNLSAKASRKNVIGNKGTGFRAILGWAREIFIRSGELSIRFSDEYAQSRLNEIQNHPTFVKGSKQYHSATLVFPEWVENLPDSGYTTDISIHVNNDKAIIDDIHQQLNDIDGELLLFLNRVEELIVETEEKVVRIKKTCLSSETTVIEKYVDDLPSDRQEWILSRQEGEYDKKNFTVVIAYNAAGINLKRQVLYSYFPTDVEFPFPVLLHANFNLQPDRNHLSKYDSANRYILEQACQLMAETALKLTRSEVSYKALQLLAPSKPVNKELSDYGFNETLLEIIRHNNLFPTVNGKYISFDDKPKFYRSSLSQVLKGEEFDDLLLHSSSDEIRKVILELNHKSYPIYSHDDMVNKINKWAKSHKATKKTMEAHANCVLGFLDEYVNVWGAKQTSKMPVLIYDGDGELVSNENAVFLSDRSSALTSPPAFAKIRFMHTDMRKAFDKLLGQGARSLVSKISAFHVNEYNTARIIEKMNSEIKKQLDRDKLTSATKHSIAELKWVWEIWESRNILEKSGDQLKIYLPTRDGKVALSDELYMGIEYGNTICENLFHDLFEYKFAGDIGVLIKGKKATDPQVKDFLTVFGVNTYPKRVMKRIQVKPNDSYRNRLLKTMSFPFSLEGEVFPTLENMDKRVYSMAAEVEVIEELDKILHHCRTRFILEWVKADQALADHFNHQMESAKSRVEIRWDSKEKYRPILISNIPSYTHWLFKTTPWIEAGGRRYKIEDCLLSKIDSVLAPVLVEPDIDDYVGDIDGNKAKLKMDFEYQLGKLGVESDFSALNVEKIYAVLNLLPELQSGEKIAKRFYLSLAQSDREIGGDELGSPAYLQFMDNGRVLCNNGYKGISESWYLDGKSICEKIANKYNLIQIPKRQNSKRIKQLLGVEKLSLVGEVVGSPVVHPANTSFVNDFKKYKPAAFCYRLDAAKKNKDEGLRFAALQIILVTQITATYTGETIELEDFDFILKDSKTFYLKTPESIGSLSEMKNNVSFAGAVANVLCSYIDVAETFTNFRELYGATDSARMELIRQVFEDDTVLDRAKLELSYSEDTKAEFLRFVSQITGKTTAKISPLVDDLDFLDINATSNAKIIIKCFRELGLDVEDYNRKQPSTEIDLRDYYKAELSRIRPQYEKAYQIHHYLRLKKQNLKNKMGLVDLFLQYENLEIKVRNSVHFDCEKELLHQLGIRSENNDMNLNTLYNKNMDVWKSQIKSADIPEEFFNNTANMSCLYYGEFEELNKAYQRMLSAQKIEEPEIEPTGEESVQADVIYPATKPVIPAVGTGENREWGSTGYTAQKNLEKIGLRGEKTVYGFLKEKYQTTKWVSENAKTAGVNPEGRAGLGYDMEYIDEHNNRKYVEVKASKTGNLLFHISGNEFDFARNHHQDFAIYFVSRAMSEKPTIMVLDDVFDENGVNEQNYGLETKEEYIVSAAIK